MTKKRWIYILLVSIVATTLVFPLQTKAQMDEKSKIQKLDCFFWSFSPEKKIKKYGKASLKVWQPYIKYSKTLSPAFQSVMLDGVERLEVDYDEIWIQQNDDSFTPIERKKYEGQFDIFKLYWKQDKVQAATVEKLYVADPFTGKKLKKPSHKIVNIYNRSLILKKLKER
jgi:hypothetical protein